MLKKRLPLLTILLIGTMFLAACLSRQTTTSIATTSPTEEPIATEAPTIEHTAATAAPATKVPLATENIESTKEPATEVKSTITLWHSWNENETASLKEVIDAFREDYPEVQFDVLYVPFDDLRGKFEQAAASGGGPTVLIGGADWGPALYDANLVADLSDMDSEELISSINSSAIGAVQYKDALIGLPQALSGVVMFRNKAIIPETPTTFDDLVAAARSATVGDMIGADLDYGFLYSGGILDGLGGKLMDEDGDPTFNDAKGVDWVNFLTRYKEAGPVEINSDNDLELFKAGKVGLIIDGTWNTAGILEAIGADNLAIDPWPSPMSGYVQTENIYLSANAKSDDAIAGWKFMEYFLSQDAQKILANPTKASHIPAITTIHIATPFIKQSIAAFAGGVTYPVNPEMKAYPDPMNNALKSVFEQGIDPSVALQLAFDEVTRKVAEIREGG